MFKKMGNKIPDHHLIFFSSVLIILFFILLFNPFSSLNKENVMAAFPPPVITFTVPTTGAFYVTSLSSITIKGTITDVNDIVGAGSWINKGTNETGFLFPPGGWSLTNTINLIWGLNKFEFSVSAGGDTTTATMNIYRLPDNGELIGYAWADTIGWISLSSLNCDSDLDGFSDGLGDCPPVASSTPRYFTQASSTIGNLSGYAWSENVGWISFNQASTTPDSQGFKVNCPPASTCTALSGCTACYNPASQKFFGWANVLSLGEDGWISLSSSIAPVYGVTFNLATNDLSGYAWNANTSPTAEAGLGWFSFNCINDGNCAISNYKTMASLNLPPTAIFVQSTPATELPCSSGVNGTEGACISNCELEPLVKWSYSDPEGFSQAKYRFIFDRDNNPTNFNEYYDSGEVAGTLNQISPAAKGVNIKYNTLYYVHIMVWDNAGLDSGWISINFTTDKHQYPNPLFTWFTPDPSAQEQIEFTASSTYYMDASGTNTNTPLSPGICQFAGSCSWLWTSTSPGSLSSNNTQSTLVTFDSAGNNTMNLVITDSDTYSCATSTNMNINKKLPTWTEVR